MNEVTSKNEAVICCVRTASKVVCNELPFSITGKLAGDVGFDPLGFTAQWADVRIISMH